MTNFRLEKNLLDKLDDLAKQHNRSRTGEVKTALLDYIHKFEPEFTLIEDPADTD